MGVSVVVRVAYRLSFWCSEFRMHALSISTNVSVAGLAYVGFCRVIHELWCIYNTEPD